MKKRRLITSALPYVNNAPHLGNIVGCVLSADVFARFSRSRGYETLYICGTDGYGTATETKAKAEGVTPEEICNTYHKIHEKVYQDFDISFDAFGKTFCEAHDSVVQGLYREVDESGYLKEMEAAQTFCESCDKFLADRFVEGECPSCHYEDARGDQCESCGKLLNPVELLKPKCATCGKQPIQKHTKHLYLDLPKISTQLEAWQNQAMETGEWTTNAKTTTKSWIDRGLNPRPITRDLKWGVPVPRPGYEDKVFYVWFDAPIGYISITKEAFPDSWEKWWKTPDETELFQFMGKDNIPFHSVIFPATLLASGQNWTTLHHLNSTEYLNYEKEKFSKSKSIGIFGTDVAELPFPIDYWRYYLMRVRPERQDSAFSWDDFADRINNELVDNLSNLVNRALIYYNKNFGEPLKEWDWSNDDDFASYIDEAKGYLDKATTAMEKNQQRDGLTAALHMGKLGNRFFQEKEPWVLIKTDKEKVTKIITLLVYTVRDLGVMLAPFTPTTSEKILSFVGVDHTWNDGGNFQNLVGVTPQKPSILFKKIDAKQVETFKDQFSGKPKATFEDLEIKVGEITSAEPHPDAKNLIVEQVNIGHKTLSVVSGLAKHYNPEDMVGKRVVLVTNLAPVTLRGTPSEAMVLVAATRKKMELLTTEAPVGTVVHRPGKTVKEPQTIGIETFEEVEITVKEGKAQCQDIPLEAAGFPIVANELTKAKVK